MEFGSHAFWIAVLQIIAIDIVLGGDNAVVIALASRSLPERQRKLAIWWGVFGAIALRVVLIFFALYLLAIPYLKAVGALLLLWIGVKLLIPERSGEGHEGVEASTTLFGAVKTIIVADAVMSLDNVIAIAGAAKGSLGLVIFGLAVSVPIIVWGSRLVLILMDRYPFVIVLGGTLLGWIAGDMLVTDVAFASWFQINVPAAGWILPIAGALFVVLLGKWIAARTLAKAPVLAELPAPAIAEAVGAPVAALQMPSGAPPATSAIPAAPAVPHSLFSRILLAVDASENAARAVQYAIDLWRHEPALDIHLVNVQRPVSSDVASFVPKESLNDYHREQSEQALRRPRSILDRAGVNYRAHTLVGRPWDAISEFAASHSCDHIVMGTRGLGSHTGALLGSVATGVVHKSPVPVILVK
jgi:YjbE family integral membrane protein